MDIENGKTYRLRHSRFGMAVVEIVKQDNEWIDVLIAKGELVGMADSWGEGETKTVRRSHCTFTLM